MLCNFLTKSKNILNDENVKNDAGNYRICDEFVNNLHENDSFVKMIEYLGVFHLILDDEVLALVRERLKLGRDTYRLKNES